MLLFSLLADQLQNIQHCAGPDYRSEATVSPAIISGWSATCCRGCDCCIGRLFGAQGVAQHVTHQRYGGTRPKHVTRRRKVTKWSIQVCVCYFSKTAVQL